MIHIGMLTSPPRIASGKLRYFETIAAEPMIWSLPDLIGDYNDPPDKAKQWAEALVCHCLITRRSGRYTVTPYGRWYAEFHLKLKQLPPRKMPQVIRLEQIRRVATGEAKKLEDLWDIPNTAQVVAQYNADCLRFSRHIIVSDNGLSLGKL